MLQELNDRDLDAVAGGLRIIIGNHNSHSFNTGGVSIDGNVSIDADRSTVQIGSNGGLLNGNSFLIGLG
jgi:hypothetical protein